MTNVKGQRLDAPPKAPGGNYLHFVLDQLADLENLSFKKTFGGIAFYLDGLLFGAITGGKFRLKAPSSCSGNGKSGKLVVPKFDTEEEVGKYYEVPTEIMLDKKQLKNWVNHAYQEALKTEN